MLLFHYSCRNAFSNLKDIFWIFGGSGVFIELWVEELNSYVVVAFIIRNFSISFKTFEHQKADRSLVADRLIKSCITITLSNFFEETQMLKVRFF